MTAVAELTDYQRFRAYYMADQAVVCPKCTVGFGRDCQSTGGGNYTTVATHKARRDRTSGWSEEQRQQFGELVWRHHRQPSEAPADLVAEAEAAAKPIPVKTAKQPTPKGVRLSEPQAEEIERAAANGGKTWVPTTHLSGEAAERQTAHALVDKGILAATGVQSRYSEREHRLTAFGWDVYRQHRLIIHREEADRCAALNLKERRP